MSNIYQKYFGEKDFYDSLAHLMYEIKENRIRIQDIVEITDVLVEKKLIPEKSMFDRKEKSSWNKEYVKYLMNGAGAGRVSREYLIYYLEVSNYVKRKKAVTISAIITIGIAITGLIIYGINR